MALPCLALCLFPCGSHLPLYWSPFYCVYKATICHPNLTSTFSPFDSLAAKEVPRGVQAPASTLCSSKINTSTITTTTMATTTERGQKSLSLPDDYQCCHPVCLLSPKIPPTQRRSVLPSGVSSVPQNTPHPTQVSVAIQCVFCPPKYPPPNAGQCCHPVCLLSPKIPT